MGDPVDPLFSDRDAFADFFTRYYTDWEPEHCMVAEDEGRVVGYLIASTRWRRYMCLQPLLVLFATLPKVIWRALTLRYNRQDVRFLAWFVCRAARETPRAPSKAAHFHINLLPAWRNTSAGRKLIFTFVDACEASGVKGVYGQIQTYEKRRPASVFERYGFEVLDKKRVTKFDHLHGDPVYVATVYKCFAA
jgi:GNAT superfamily N-acetyltransferase